jgi:hypothetical protein
MAEKKEKPVIPPLPEECTFETCDVPSGCNYELGSDECIKMRKKYYGKKK